MQRVNTLTRKDKTEFQRGKSYDRLAKSKKHKKQDSKDTPNQVLKQFNKQSLQQHKSVENYRTKSPLKRFLQLRLGDVYSSQLGQMLKLLEMQKKVKAMLQNGHQSGRRLQLQSKIQFLKNQQESLIHKVQDSKKSSSSDKNIYHKEQRKNQLISQKIIKIYEHMGGQVTRQSTEDSIFYEIIRIFDNKKKAIKSIFQQLQSLAFGSSELSQKQTLTFKQILLRLRKMMDSSKKNKQQQKDMMKKIVELEKTNIKLRKDCRKVQEQFQCLVQQKLLLDNRLDRTKGMVSSMQHENQKFKKHVMGKLTTVMNELSKIRQISKFQISSDASCLKQLNQTALKWISQFELSLQSKQTHDMKKYSQQINQKLIEQRNLVASLQDRNKQLKQQQAKLISKISSLQQQNNRISNRLLLLQQTYSEQAAMLRQQNAEKLKQANKNLQIFKRQLDLISQNNLQKENQLNQKTIQIQKYSQNLRQAQKTVRKFKHQTQRLEQQSVALKNHLQQIKIQKNQQTRQSEMMQFGVKMIFSLYQICTQKHCEMLLQQNFKSIRKQQQLLESQKSFRDLLREFQNTSNELKQKISQNTQLKMQKQQISVKKNQQNTHLIKRINELEQSYKIHHNQVFQNQETINQIKTNVKDQISRYFSQLERFQINSTQKINQCFHNLSENKAKLQHCKSAYQQRHELTKISIIENQKKNQEISRRYLQQMSSQFLINSEKLQSVYKKSLDQVQAKIIQLQKLYKLFQDRLRQLKGKNQKQVVKAQLLESSRKESCLNYHQVLQHLLQQLLFSKVYLSLQSKIKMFSGVQRQKLNRYRQKIAQVQCQLSIIQKQRQTPHCPQQFLTNQKLKKQDVQVVEVHSQIYDHQKQGQNIWKNVQIIQRKQRQQNHQIKQQQPNLILKDQSNSDRNLKKETWKDEPQNSYQKDIEIELPLFNFISQHPSQNSIIIQNQISEQQKQGSLSKYGLWQFANQDILNQQIYLVKAQLDRCIRQNYQLRKMLNIQQLDLIIQEP